MLEKYFGAGTNAPEEIRVSTSVGGFLLRMESDRMMKENFNLAIVEDDSLDSPSAARAQHELSEFMKMEQRVEVAFRIHCRRFPTSIWHCCRHACFADIATDPMKYPLFGELIQIHEYAEKCHSEAERLGLYVGGRRKGTGTSNVAFVTASRAERESQCGGRSGTNREIALREFAKFVVEVLPFLYGSADAPSGTSRPARKICTNAICCLLGVSKTSLYHRKYILNPDTASEDELTSLIDIAGLRLRQHRRNGIRANYPPLNSLQRYDCGCDVPCFIDIPQWTLVTEYNEFIKLAKQLKPRHKETCFLLNRLFCPLSNSSLNVCNRALSALYTVSEARIADVRRAVGEMCENSNDDDTALLSDPSTMYNYQRNHPMNRYSTEIRERIETHLDMVLRADPAGSIGESVCRVYSPEINTQQKLRKVLRESLGTEESLESGLSESTLATHGQRLS